ncbi:MAG TPA: hypothetical protein VJG32_09575 [Anaerolineae bacterium]|nr:hypothetical protein [Anaerolineae bacterium]
MKPCSLFLTLALLLSSCSPPFDRIEEEKIHIDIPSGQKGINIGDLLNSVMNEVAHFLPNAYLTGFVFAGKCADLPQLRGSVTLTFAESRPGFLTKQILWAVAVTNTEDQLMDISIEDGTSYYVATDRLNLNGDKISLNEVTEIALKNIAELGFFDSDCEVVLTRVGDSWDVGCEHLETFIRECEFTIDPSNGIIKNIKP